jgi:hypothetical protein
VFTLVFTLEQVKEIAGEPDMPDEQAKLLRDSAQGMAEIVLDLMREKKKKGPDPSEDASPSV